MNVDTVVFEEVGGSCEVCNVHNEQVFLIWAERQGLPGTHSLPTQLGILRAF